MWCSKRCSYRLGRPLLLPCRSESGVRGVLLLTPETKHTQHNSDARRTCPLANRPSTNTPGRWVRVQASRLWLRINDDYEWVGWKWRSFALMRWFYKTCLEAQRKIWGCSKWVGGKNDTNLQILRNRLKINIKLILTLLISLSLPGKKKGFYHHSFHPTYGVCFAELCMLWITESINIIQNHVKWLIYFFIFR